MWTSEPYEMCASPFVSNAKTRRVDCDADDPSLFGPCELTYITEFACPARCTVAAEPALLVDTHTGVETRICYVRTLVYV